jgi:hypothetical protein
MELAVEQQAFELLMESLRSLQQDVKELRDSVSKLYIKIAVIATAGGILGGKASNFLPKLVDYARETLKIVVG